MAVKTNFKCLGVIGGLGAIAGADIFSKLVKASVSGEAEHPALVFEQRPFAEDVAVGQENASANARKLYVFDMVKSFERRNVDLVILPCFISHTFLDELLPEIKLPIANIMEALRDFVKRRHPNVRDLGILTSDHVRKKGMFERYFPAAEYRLIYPRAEIQKDCLMRAIYGPQGIKAGQLRGDAIAQLNESCRDLAASGAELIVPGFTEIPVVLDALGECGVPIIDSNQVYVRHALEYAGGPTQKMFKIGIIGGVGPAATVDFMGKIVRHTPARKDQEHVKIIVEHNPQIPDRTENLIGAGADPTVALYSACKKLEANDADLIAIPCNTAHAFVERIQPYLAIPIVNMLHETVEYLHRGYPKIRKVGLLATSGTIASRVYHDVAEKAGLNLIVPDEPNQKKVMDSIYGPKGVKAGFTDGQCRRDLLDALEFVVKNGSEAVILGCTELPLILAQDENYTVCGKTVVVLDPTEILAKKCVSFRR